MINNPEATTETNFDALHFEQVFMQHYSYLCATSYFILSDEEQARDIVQDFFLYCWSKKLVLNNPEYFKSYAYRSVRHASLNLKKRASKFSFEDPLLMERNMLAEEPSIESKESEIQRKALIWEGIGNLPQQRRHIFLLSNRDGLKYREIAEQLNISVNTVKTQIRLAYQFLRKEYGWLVTAAGLLVLKIWSR